MPYVPTTRKPTGVPSAPLIMVSGLAKSGKSMTAYKLGQSPRIAHCWVADLGEGSADEYGELDCYEVIEWGRTFADLVDTVRWCIDQPAPEGQMNALIIDSGTDLWDSLKWRADRRARGSKANAAKLREDPDYEVDVSMPYWNDAKDVWARIVSPMKLAGNLIGVVLVRSEVVAEVVGGVPTNRKITSYQCEKTLQGTVTAHVTVDPDHTSRVIEARSFRLSVPPRGTPLASANPLGELIDLLAPPSGSFAAPAVHSPLDEGRMLDTNERQMLIDLVMSVRDTDMRESVKTRLVSQYGRTTEITKDRFDEVVIWLSGLVVAVNGDEPPPAPAAIDEPIETPPAEPEQQQLTGPLAAALAQRPTESAPPDVEPGPGSADGLDFTQPSAVDVLVQAGVLTGDPAPDADVPPPLDDENEGGCRVANNGRCLTHKRPVSQCRIVDEARHEADRTADDVS